MLLDLQACDSQIDRLLEEKAEMPEKKAYQKAKDDILRVQKELLEISERIKLEISKRKKLELEVDGISLKIKNGEERLYSGIIKHDKERDGLEKEIKFLKEKADEVETIVIEQIDLIDHEESRLVKLKHDLEHGQQVFQKAKLAAELRLEELKDKYKELQESRQSIASKIDKDDLELYESLRASKRGVAVARIKRNVCQGCHTSLPTDEIEHYSDGQEKWFCSSCGRLIMNS